MTLKPNYALVFVKISAWVIGLIIFFEVVVPYVEGKAINIVNSLLLAASGGLLFGVVVAIIFTPREITWNDETIKIKAVFPGSGEFNWQQLEAWTPNGRGTFIIKFENRQAFQISPAGFRSKEWKMFEALLQDRFPEKKTSVWIGVTPIRFKKK